MNEKVKHLMDDLDKLKKELYTLEGKVNEAYLLRAILATPGGDAINLLHMYIKIGMVTYAEARVIDKIATALVSILAQAHNGDDVARNQIEAVYKITHPGIYELPTTVIEDLVESYHTRASLARGWLVRKEMGRLSHAVSAIDPSKGVLEGEVRLAEPDECDYEIYRTVAKAFQRMRKTKTTLQALAINVLQEEDRDFTKKDTQSIMRDLRRVEEWEASLPEGSGYTLIKVHGGAKVENIIIGQYSEGWRKRKSGSGGARKMKSKKS